MTAKTTTTATRKPTTRKAAAPAKPTVIRQLSDGRVILIDLPFMIDGLGREGGPGRSTQLMNSRGLGWAFEQVTADVKGWVGSGAGAVSEAIETLAAYGVRVIDETGAGAAPAAPAKATRKAAPAKAAPAKAAPASIMTNAETAAHGARGDIAAKITAALLADGVDTEIIAAAVAAAIGAADKIAKAATATASAAPVVKPVRKVKNAAPVTVTRKAAPAKAAPAKAAPAKAAPADATLTGLSGAQLVELGTPAALAEIERRAAKRAAKRAAASA